MTEKDFLSVAKLLKERYGFTQVLVAGLYRNDQTFLALCNEKNEIKIEILSPQELDKLIP